MLKWRRRFKVENNSMWRRIITSIHGVNGGLDEGNNRLRGSGVWVALDGKGIVPLSTLRKEVGNGSKTRFWYDTWLGNALSMIQFPRMFAREAHKHCLVADKWREGTWVWSWNRTVRQGMDDEDKPKQVAWSWQNFPAGAHVPTGP